MSTDKDKKQQFLDACYTILDCINKVYADDRVIVEYYDRVNKAGLKVTRKPINNPDRPNLSVGNPVVYVFPEEEEPCRFHGEYKVIHDHVVKVADRIENSDETLYIGYHEEDQLPVAEEDRVKIPKGTQLKSMHPDREEPYEAGKTYTVTVSRIGNGFVSGYGHERETFNPKVVWSGTGGYWVEADINDIEQVEDN